MSHYLGIDIGTFESKGVLVEAGGRIVASAARPHKMLVPQPGWAEHRAREDWWDDLVYLGRTLLADSGLAPGDVKAIACSAIGPCLLPVDAAGEPLCNAILYGVDTRAALEIEELTAAIGEATLIGRCGNALTSQSVGPKIAWLKRHRPEIHARAERMLTSTSYLVFRLTGEYVMDHYTAANFSPLYLVDEQGWSSELSADIVELEKLPRLAWSTEIAGALSARAAAQTGLAEGTPVTVGTIDAAAEAVSVGVREPGEMMIMYGSTVFTIMPTAERVTDPRLWYAPWLFAGRHASMAGLATSGTLTHWFREQFARELPQESALAELAAQAESAPPGANGLVFLPYFSGERTPIHDPSAKGCLFGLNLTHTRADVYRALLEGIACATRHILDTYREIGHPPRRLLAVGGGTRNRVWSQATSDLAGLAQDVCRQTLGASYGDAFMAALAVGDAAQEDIAHWNPVETRLGPAPSAAGERQYAVFRQLYENTREQMKALDGRGRVT